ncbi:N-formyl peptide receptor 2-like [Pyxicephalus adspersus]|uniref:N-formyl peptide receptor 2-like n=1 Tax=Pyxicephalus adspersus TaxID=30357 RepID=UPI003B5B8975
METNTTNASHTDDASHNFPNKTLIILFLTALSGIILLGTTGNGLVIWFVVFRMKKTVNSVWFLSLALADFTFCLSLILNATYIALGYWPFGTFMCKLNLLALHLNMSASVLQLTIISIDRCISVVFPVWCWNHRTPRLAIKVILAVWIVSLLINVPYFIKTDTFKYDELQHCFINLSLEEAQVIIRFVVLFVIPFTIIFICYTLILLHVRKSGKATSTKPFKVIISVIISFFVCWFPFHVTLLIVYNGSYTLSNHLGFIPNIVVHVSFLMACSNSCINPLLYVFVGQDLKEKFWITIKSGFERAFTEDINQTYPKREINAPAHEM